MLLFLYGEDLFRSKEKLKELQRKFIEKNPNANLIIFDFAEKNTNQREFIESLKSDGLFSQKKLIVALNFLKEVPAEKQKELLKIFKKNEHLPANEDMVIIFHESPEPKKNLSFFKYLFAYSKKQSFPLLQGYALSKWAEEYIKNISPTISFAKNSLNLLTSSVGNDLYSLKNELDKLINYKNTGEITEDDVKKMVRAGIQSSVFEAIESLLSGNKKRSLELLHEQLQKGEDPFYLLSMYAYQMRTLMKISAAYNNGNMMPQMIARQTKLHPFVVQKSLAQVRNISLEKLKSIFSELTKIDRKTKTGQAQLIQLLDQLIAKI